MRKITDFIVKCRNLFLVSFILLAIFSLYLSTKVDINDDIMAYLPKSSETKIGKDIMDNKFPEQKSATLNLMFEGLNKKEKEITLKKLEKVDGVSSVLYDSSKDYNKGKYTLYVLNVDDYAKSKTSEKVYNYVKDNFNVKAMSGSIDNEYKPILQYYIVALAIGGAMLILIILSESYVEPFLYLVSIGIAVFINKGTNIIFPSVSSVTNSIAAILQLALSMDYSIMLTNRFRQEKKKNPNKKEAMKEALYHSFKAISSSSVTTVVGLLALVFMSFTIGKDLGFVLAKGVILSLISIFCCLPALLLMFDNLIDKTKKKSPIIKLDKLGVYSYKTRFVQLFLVTFLFIGAFLLKGNINILYTGSQQDEVGKVFKANNQIAVVYDNKYQDFMTSLCKDLETDKKVTSVLCYSNTINEKLTYNNLNDKFNELGKDIKIDDNLLKIIYYNYYSKDGEKISLNNLLSFIKSDIYTNKKFSSKISSDVKENIDLLSNFTDKNSINKKRSSKEISSLLGISEKDVDKIIVYYNSKNNQYKMTIKNFVEFLVDDVSKDSEYSSYFDKDTLSKLNTLKPFIDKNLINKKLSSTELSKIFNIDKNKMDGLMTLYFVNQDSKTKLTINEFSKFALELSNSDEYKSMFNSNIVNDLTRLKNLSDESLISNNLTYNDMKLSLSNLGFNLSDEDLLSLYIYYSGSKTNTKLNLNTYSTVLLSMASNDLYKAYFDEATIVSINTIKSLTENYNTTMSNSNLYSMFNIGSEKAIKINYAVTGSTSGTYSMTPLEFVNFILSTNEIKNELSESELVSLNKSLYIMNNVDTLYNPTDIENSLGIDKNISYMIFGTYLKETNNLSSISIKSFIGFIYNNKDNYLFKNKLSSYADLIKLAYVITNKTEDKYLYSNLSSLINQDSSIVKKIYGLYDYLKLDSKLSSYELTNFIIKNKDIDLIKNNIKSSDLNNLILVNQVMKNVIDNKKLSSTDLNKIISVDKNKLDLIYSLYSYKNNKTNISLYNFVNVITIDLINNEDYKNKFNDDIKNKLVALNQIMSDSLNDVKYTSSEVSDNLSSLSKSIDKSLINLVYIYYGSKNNYNDSWSLTIEQLVNYLVSDVINDSKYSSFINQDMKNKIIMAKSTIDSSKELLVSKDYSRIIINSKYNFEDKESYEFVKSIKDKVGGKDKIYVVGNTPMAYEMSKSFNGELNRITILTMIFIFVVVLFTFKDVLIPLILVLIIQTAVYITMSFISFTGGNVYFLSLIIVQAILMGATIDYAIVYTSYYKENRLKHDVKTSLIKSYNKSIHTIISSSSILIIVTLIVSNFASAIAAKICETVSQGTFAATVLILFVLPGTLAACDKLICRGNKYKKN